MSPWIQARVRATVATLVVLACTACASQEPAGQPAHGADGKADDFAETVAADEIVFDVEVLWSVGEGEEEEPLDSAVAFDEEEWLYQTSQEVRLGPLSECMLSFSDRSPDAICRWELPSSWWDVSLYLTFVDEVPVVDVIVSGGDADTGFSTALPAASVPTATPWSFDFNPDNASGAWGSVEMSLTRRAPPSSEEGADPVAP